MEMAWLPSRTDGSGRDPLLEGDPNEATTDIAFELRTGDDETTPRDDCMAVLRFI